MDTNPRDNTGSGSDSKPGPWGTSQDGDPCVISGYTLQPRAPPARVPGAHGTGVNN